MTTLFSLLIIVASILLILVVFVQNPKGGGLSSDFGAAQQIGGVQKTNDFIEKATWTLAGTIMVLSIILTIRAKSVAPVVEDQQQQQTEQNGGAQGGQQGQQGKKPAGN